MRHSSSIDAAVGPVLISDDTIRTWAAGGPRRVVTAFRIVRREFLRALEARRE